jgi:aspartate aminotransferase
LALKGTEIKMQWIYQCILAEANVATVTGDAFGNPDCIRFSYATSDEILKKLKRIKDALAL